MDIGLSTTLLAGDPRLVDHIVGQVKSQGIFDQFRKECIADVDTKPAYQNLRTRVESAVNSFLKSQTWKPDMNKNQLRESLRKHIHDASFLDVGVERIVDQVVNPKIYSVFMPQIEDVVYKFLGMERPKPREKNGACNLKDLLPKDLDPVSPESDRNSLKEESLESMDISFEDRVNGQKETTSDENKPQTSKTVSVVKVESEINKEEENKKTENSKNNADSKKIEEPIKLDEKKVEEVKKVDVKKLDECKIDEVKKEEEFKFTEEVKNGQIDIDENSMDGFEKSIIKTASGLNLNVSFKSDDKTEEEEESPQFEPIDIMNLNESNLSNDSHLSGISELTSHRSRTPDYSNDFSRDNFEFTNHDQDSHLSKVSSNSRLSIVTDFGSSNQASTPFFNSNENSKDKFAKDNFKIIREIEDVKQKESKFNFDGFKGQEKDSKSVKSLSSRENSRDETEGVLKEKNEKDKIEIKDFIEKSESRDGNERSVSKDRKGRSESKDRKERSESKDRKEREERKERSESKERKERSESKDRKEKSESKDGRDKSESSKSRNKSDSRDSRRHKDRKKSSSSSSRHSKSRKESEHSKEKKKEESSSKDKIKEERKEKDEKEEKKDEKKDLEKQEGLQDIKDLKDIYKEKIRELREKIELTEKEKLNKDSKERRDSSRDKKDYKKDHKTSRSSDRYEKSSKTKSSDSKDSKDKKRDDRRHSRDSKSRSSRSEKDSRKKDEKNEKSKDTKNESQSSKEKKQRDEKKSKSKDDHSSLKRNSNDRRSTDRDGSNGSNGKSSHKSTSSGTKTVSTTLTKEANNTNNSSGDTSEGIEDSQGNDNKVSSGFESQTDISYKSSISSERENCPKADGNSNETCLPLKKRPLPEDSSSPSSSGESRAKRPKLSKDFLENKYSANLRRQSESLDDYRVKKLHCEKQNPVEDITKVPDEERVQIIEVPDEECDEAYSEPVPNLTLEETAMIILQGDLVGPSNVTYNNQKKESKLSLMEESIRKSLDEMMSDQKLVESSDPVANPERPIETEAQKSLKDSEAGKDDIKINSETEKSKKTEKFKRDEIEENLEKLERGDLQWDDLLAGSDLSKKDDVQVSSKSSKEEPKENSDDLDISKNLGETTVPKDDISKEDVKERTEVVKEEANVSKEDVNVLKADSDPSKEISDLSKEGTDNLEANTDLQESSDDLKANKDLQESSGDLKTSSDVNKSSDILKESSDVIKEKAHLQESSDLVSDTSNEDSALEIDLDVSKMDSDSQKVSEISKEGSDVFENDSEMNKIETSDLEKTPKSKENRGKDEKILSPTMELRVSMGIKRSTEELMKLERSLTEFSQEPSISNQNKEKTSKNIFDIKNDKKEEKECPVSSPMEDACLYFEPDNERYLKFTNFLKSYEKELSTNKQETSFIENLVEVKPAPKTMAPPQILKRKLSSSPLSDILLHNANNNNDGNKEGESEIHLEEGEPAAKKKKLGRPKKQRPSISSFNPPPLLNGENFDLPMSPESDVSASSEKTPSQTVKEEKSRQRNNQRYSSDDLYKPRPLFATSSRRNRRSNQA